MLILMKHLNSAVYIFVNILTIQITVNSSTVVPLSREDKKIHVSPMYSVTSTKRDYIFTKKNSTAHQTYNISSTPNKFKKWQLGRVTRKQYEVINILWKKTKLFVNYETTTTYPSRRVNATKNFLLRPQESYHLSPPHSGQQTSTPSCIEFYYLDEAYSYSPPKDSQTRVEFNRLNKDRNRFDFKSNTRTRKSFIKNNNDKSPNITVPFAIVNHTNLQLKPKSDIRRFVEPTTAYDKIRFFEIYDNHTEVYSKKTMNFKEMNVFKDDTSEYDNNQKILLKHVDQSIGYDNSHHNGKHAKKHITESFTEKSNSHVQEINNKTFYTNPIYTVSAETKTDYTYTNKSVLWSEYPFVAVYIYEPAQVHCDAAGISPHWLVTAGACLSRHHKEPLGEGHSAFVAFCGESWWLPERVAYVKYSVVHPQYHPGDLTRKHLYNIGVVQVVISMLSCTGWSPVPLMSHQYATDQEESVALALGWGLDRYDTRHAFTDLPKWPLMAFKGKLHSDSCPGNIEYSKAKYLGEESVMKNVYCLSLPPYAGEEKDPIHGSLLLVGGKLMALYLQEERRSWGEQSAQYTGTWRLIPWVLNVAREPEVEDSFTFEI